MGKIGLIIQREYIQRVKKKSFIALTLLGPVLMAAVFILPIWLSMRDHKTYKVAVVDKSHLTDSTKLHGADFLHYVYVNDSIKAKEGLKNNEYSIVLVIPTNVLTTPQAGIVYKDQPGIIAEEKIRSDVGNFRDDVLRDQYNLKQILDSLHLGGNVILLTKSMDEKGNIVNSNSQAGMIIGMISAVIMYVFIFLYGVQVMRGVMEEKTNRIVEVIVSAVRPFQLMMGKIIGVALVGLTQFIIWIVLTFALVTIGSATVLKSVQGYDPTMVKNDPLKNLKQGSNITELKQEPVKKEDIDLGEIYKGLGRINFYKIIACFIFYFLGGYLLYSALFAAVGSAVDAETDAQQFMLPITVPIIFAIVMAQSVILNPDGPMAFWLSMIPFTSPVIMMIRIQFIEPGWQLALSMSLLVAGFIFTVWLAGKIYRTGILMYGKKVTWRELGKWLRYKE